MTVFRVAGTALCLSNAFAAVQITFNVSPTVPSNASAEVDPAFVGFAFEQGDFYQYAFDSQSGGPNTFSQNLITSVAKRTSTVPVVRVGGTSGDESHYDASQTTPLPPNHYGNISKPLVHCNNYRDCLSIGPSYFDAFKQLYDVKYMAMVPQRQLALNNSRRWTTAALEAIGENLDALEIGNEPDLARWYSAADYAHYYNEYAQAIIADHPQLQEPILQALDISYEGGSRTDTSPNDIIQKHGLKIDNVKQIAYHFYGKIIQDDTLPNLQRSIANHTYLLQGDGTNHGLNVYKSYIKQAVSLGLPFVFSEVGADGGEVTLGRKRPLNIKRRNNMALALWNADFMLHSMAIGVSRINLQTSESFFFSLWQPGPSVFAQDKLVRAAYYAMPFVADFIGPCGCTRVVELGSTSDGTIVAYAAYDGESLARIALLNMHLWVPDNGTRPNAHIVIDGLPSSTAGGRAEFLTGAGGAYDESPSWAGLQWTAESNGKETKVIDDSIDLSVIDGRISLSLNSTSAAIITLT